MEYMKIVNDEIDTAPQGECIHIEDREIYNPRPETYYEYGYDEYDDPEPQEGKYYVWEIVEEEPMLFGGGGDGDNEDGYEPEDGEEYEQVKIKVIRPVFYDLPEEEIPEGEPEDETPDVEPKDETPVGGGRLMSVFRQLLMYNRYIPVDYITCTGAQYINTGIQWSTAQQLDITANLSATNTNKTETILGVYGGTNYCTPIRIKRDSNNKFVISLLYRTGGWIYTKTSTNTFNAGTFYTMTTSWKTTKFTFKVENTSIDMSQGGTSITNPYSSDTTFSKPFYLFALNNNGSPSEYFYGNLKSMTITIAGSVVMNLTPVYDDILEEYGLYDTISEKFYGSESGTKFNGAAVNYNQ